MRNNEVSKYIFSRRTAERVRTHVGVLKHVEVQATTHLVKKNSGRHSRTAPVPKPLWRKYRSINDKISTTK